MTNADFRHLVVVDTNVLLAATDRGRTSHAEALAFLNGDTRQLALTPQIVREYLAVATRPAEANGLGLTGSDAATNVAQFLDDVQILPENTYTARRVNELVGEDMAIGKQVHDANIVAVAVAHGAHAIVTDNLRHFERFADSIAIESLL